MIGPLEILHSSREGRIVIMSTTDVNDKVVLGMAFVEVGDNILYGITIGFFDQV